MQHRVLNTGNLEVVWDHVPVEILGDSKGVNGVLVEHVKSGVRKQLDIQGFFVAIDIHRTRNFLKVSLHWIKTDISLLHPIRRRPALRVFLPAEMCRIMFSGRQSQQRVRVAWQPWKQNGFLASLES